MRTFLGVPIVIEGRAWGNLYLTEKAGGEEFTAGDEEAAVVLADWAAIAINNARLYRDVRERRDELERTIRGLETTTEISRALGRRDRPGARARAGRQALARAAGRARRGHRARSTARSARRRARPSAARPR